MGDQIGNYIHYTTGGYKRYGITPSEEGNNWNQVANAHFNILKHYQDDLETKNEDNEAALLTAYFNFFYSGVGTAQILNGYDEAKLKEAAKVLTQIIKQSLDSNMIFEEKTMSVRKVENAWSYGDIQTSVASKTGSKLGKYSKNQRTTIQRIKEKYDAFRAGYEQLYKMLEYGPLNEFEMSFLQRFQQLEEDFGFLIQEIRPNSTPITGRKNSFLQAASTWQVNGQTFIQALNEIDKFFKTEGVANENGDILEFVPIIQQYLVEQGSSAYSKSLDELKAIAESGVRSTFLGHSLLSQRVGGSSNSKAYVISDSNIYGTDKVKSKRTNNGRRVTKIGDVTLELTEVQQKVDVKITVDDSTTLPISLKNVKGLSNVHIHGGSNLLKMIQDYPVFVNHYLNLTASHAEGSLDSNDIDLANDLMRMTVGIRSLAGGMLIFNHNKIEPAEKAKFLIVNDNKTGKIKVILIADIINTLAQIMGAQERRAKTGIDGVIKIESSPSRVFEGGGNIRENKWIGEARNDFRYAFRRCIDMVGYLARVKYDVSINLNKV